MISTERMNEVANGLESALCAHLKARVVNKEQSLLHRGIATAFDAVELGENKLKNLLGFLSFAIPDIGLPSGAEYLSNFATTIGEEVALPGKWREPANALQRVLILSHEMIHVRQHQKGVDAGWWPKSVTHPVMYLCSVAIDDAAEYLGKVEADAYAATECVNVWLGGTSRPINSVVDSLKRHYALSSKGQETAGGILKSHYATIASGGVPNLSVCRFTMDWLQNNASDLKGNLSL